MRGIVNYISKNNGDCASDIDLSLSHTEEEKDFIKWTIILQKTISELQQTVDYYEDFYSYYLVYSCERFNCFLTNYLGNLSLSISINIAKLIAKDDDLTIAKYNDFCRKAKMFDSNQNIQNAVNENSQDIKIMRKLFEEKFYLVRNKIYGHNSEELLDFDLIDSYVDNIDFKDMRLIIETSKKVVSKIWKAYNQHELCFELEGKNDYKNILRYMKNHSRKV